MYYSFELHVHVHVHDPVLRTTVQYMMYMYTLAELVKANVPCSFPGLYYMYPCMSYRTQIDHRTWLHYPLVQHVISCIVVDISLPSNDMHTHSVPYYMYVMT
jgi:hypothetical protein